MKRLTELLNNFISMGVSDVYFISGNRPSYKKDGQVSVELNQDLIDSSEVSSFCEETFKIEQVAERKSKDVAVTYNSQRLRANVYQTHFGLAVVVRVLPMTIPTFEELHLPKQIENLISLKDGLVIVCGTTESGKTTTIASLLERFNNTRNGHIITIGDPLEYIYTPNKCCFTMREVGTDVPSYFQAIVDSMRQSSTIININEMRDPDTVLEGLRAAETGHLVITSIHSETTFGVMDRMLNLFPAVQQEQVKYALTRTIKAIVHQTLVPRIQGGRLPLMELAFVDTRIQSGLNKSDMTVEGLRDLLRSSNNSLHRGDSASQILAMGADPKYLQSVLSDSDYALAIRRSK